MNNSADIPLQKIGRCVSRVREVACHFDCSDLRSEIPLLYCPYSQKRTINYRLTCQLSPFIVKVAVPVWVPDKVLFRFGNAVCNSCPCAQFGTSTILKL